MFTQKRQAYQELFKDCESGNIDVVVVMKYDRLSRDVADSVNAIKLLNLYGCFLIAGDGVADDSTPAGEFMRNIMFAQNTYHARRTASDVMYAECNNAKNGVSAGGVAPYGLKYVNKRYVIDNEEADAVRTAFAYIAAGKSYNQVITQLKKLRLCYAQR